MESLKALSRLSKYLRKHRQALVLGSFCILALQLIGLAIPWLMKLAVDAIPKATRVEELFKYGALIVAASLVQGVFRFAMRRLMIGASREMEYELRNDLFTHLLKLSPAYFSRTKTGDLMARATNDTSAVREFLGPGIMYSVNTVITMVTATALMLYIDPVLTAFALLPIPALALVVNRFGRLVRERFEQVQQQFSRLTARAHESISGIRVVKAYAGEEQDRTRFTALNEEYVTKNLSLVRVWGTFHPLIALVGGIGAVIVLWLGGLQVIRGRISLGDFVAFSGYLAMLTWPAIAMGWVVNLVQRGAASMGRIAQILDQKPEIADSDTVPMDRICGEIEFRNVSFSYYPGGPEVLRNVSFRVPAGRKLAIVGRTGCGKSTVINLVPRLFEPTSGQILIDGVDVRRIPLVTLRRHIGYAPQESFLFSDTIRANIAYGLSSARDEEIAEVAEMAKIAEEVEEFAFRFET
ncbi:MAG: ATP-binding cassette domain-containing protein, partial [Candidatus Eisenbacteria bacterium]|nr:ATP-binding cassette domain-containing protein [Candidatus Eisenbacteria bacterium]